VGNPKPRPEASQFEGVGQSCKSPQLRVLAFAAMEMGMSGSASFQSARNLICRFGGWLHVSKANCGSARA